MCVCVYEREEKRRGGRDTDEGQRARGKGKVGEIGKERQGGRRTKRVRTENREID